MFRSMVQRRATDRCTSVCVDMCIDMDTRGTPSQSHPSTHVHRHIARATAMPPSPRAPLLATALLGPIDQSTKKKYRRPAWTHPTDPNHLDIQPAHPRAHSLASIRHKPNSLAHVYTPVYTCARHMSIYISIHMPTHKPVHMSQHMSMHTLSTRL